MGTRSARPRLRQEIVLGLLTFGIYLVVDLLVVQGRRATADGNGRALFELELTLHLDIAYPLNHALAPHQVLTTIANYEYALTYIASALLLLAWVYLRRPWSYRRVRDSFLLLNLLAIGCFALYPVTPPRLLHDLGFFDTVTAGGTWGSWGSPLVAHANQLAAMPSLHIAWALWVSVVLARLAGGRLIQVLSALHVAVTVLVILATANHYLLDAVAAVPFILVSVGLTDLWHDRARRPGTPVQSSDAFFLQVETPRAPQHVGGVALLADPRGGDGPPIEALRDLARDEFGPVPRFRQRLEESSRWRRDRWVDVPELDWEWHVGEHRLGDDPAGDSGLFRLVADLATTPLPRDRPMWRIVLVRGIAPGRAAMVILVHHAVADGIGTVLKTLQLFRPATDLVGSQESRPSRIRSALGIVVGLGQLATDGSPATRLGPGSPRRAFGSAAPDVREVRHAAHEYGVRVTDVLLCALATAVRDVQPDLVTRTGGSLRVSVPLMVRAPDPEAEGNGTAAVMLDVPLGPMPGSQRLAEIHRRTERLRTPTRALASRFVMARVLAALPAPAIGWFARTVYGERFLQAIVSNMPGPREQLSLCGVPIPYAVPVLPLAPGAPVAVGALSWSGRLVLGIATDPGLVDAEALAAGMDRALHALVASSGDGRTVNGSVAVRLPQQREQEPST